MAKIAIWLLGINSPQFAPEWMVHIHASIRTYLSQDDLREATCLEESIGLST
jgi:hypothetical protein